MPVVPQSSYVNSYPNRGVTIDPDSDIGIGLAVGVGARDGTPARVAGVLLLSAAILAALKIAGWRFNVAVSS